MALDEFGNLFVADTRNHRVMMFDPAGDVIKTWGSEGVGDGEFDNPWDVDLDASGRVSVVDACRRPAIMSG